ncbi:MAG: carbohydrate-binding protein [Prevotella sp.]|nr:carbohydrate-binding protein [Prevotella sp.]
MKKLFLFSMMLVMALTVQAQRVTDKLTRGLVAIPQGDKTGQDNRYGMSGSGIFVSWRILPTEYFDTKYNLYRNGTKVNAEPLAVSNYEDTGGTKDAKYQVIPVIRGVERTDLKSEEVTPWEHQYWDITVKNVVNRAGTDVTSQYTLNDCSVADVDGDGEMEFVVKRRNDSGLNVSGNTTTFNLHECYKMDGTRLWWIDMGPNMMAGPDEQFDLILYDWDGDGKAEALMRGADNMIIHTASGKEIKIGNMDYYAPRDEYTKEGAEYLLYMNGETGEPYAWDGSDNWTPMAYPLPRYETGESNYATVWGATDTGHRATKHYFGAPYLDGRNPSIFLGRGCYTRHKFCALDVNPTTHELTQRWRWNCYDSKSPWFGNGFHNFAIADVDLDGRDEIVFGSMIIDDTGYGLSTTGFGHGDAQHCGDLDPYRWGLEQFVCLESAAVPGICYTDATASDIRYVNGTGGDNGRCMAGNFQGTYPGAIGITFGSDVISLVADKVITGVNMANDDYMNMRVYWDGDLLDEFMDSPGVERSPCVYKYGNEVGTNRTYANGRCWMGGGSLNNSSKNNPCFLGDILGDWREEIVNRIDATTLRINISSYPSPWGITSLWYDHEYRNGMTWQSVGYNQPPHPSFFLGELEGITKEPPAITLEGRTEVTGTIGTTDDHLLISGYENKTIAVTDGASPYILTVNTPAWVKGSGVQQAVAGTPKQPARTIETYTTTLTGGAFSGATRIVKQGEGVLVLPNVTEKHTGTTDIWQGTLQFDGTFESSPLWLNRHTTLISNGGQFLGGIKADYNAAIYPGGVGTVGSITATKLDMGFGSRIVIDINGSANDKLNANELTIEAKTTAAWINYGPRYKAPVIQINSTGILQPGTYVIGNIGTLTGDLSELLIEGLDNTMKTSLVYEGGQLKLVAETMRAAATATWNGSTGNTTWQQAVTENFLVDNQPTYSAHGDNIVFDDNAASTTVTIKGAVSPATVTFANDTKAYTLQRDSIVGGATITKGGKANVTINNWNRTGATTINNGMLIVSMLANNSGQDFGSLGNASQQITINDGATLRTNGVIVTDQQLNISGEATVDVPEGKSVIFNKGIRGTGATLVKTGSGTLETGTGATTISKVVIKAGRMTANYSSSHVEQLPKTVEFQGGILWGANDESTNVNNSANFVVPEGKTGTYYGGFRSTYTGTLTGAGTFNVYTGGVRCYWNGNWSAFTGTVKCGKENRQNKKSYDPVFDFNNTYGLPNATLEALADVTVSNDGKAFPVGKLTGAGTFSGTGQWQINYNGTTSYTLSATVNSPVLKRGTGKMTLTVGKINGTLTVEAGTVTFNNAALNTSLHGAYTTTVRTAGRLVGQGQLNALALNSGGELVPCGSTFNETTPGTIKSLNNISSYAGSTVNFLINSTKNSTLQAANRVTMQGTLKVTLLSGFTPKNGDSFTLWTAASYAGTPQYDLPELPDGLYWDISGLEGATGVLRVTDDASVGIGRIADSEQVACEVYTTGGVLVGTFETKRSDIRPAVARLGLKSGLYIVRMAAGRNYESETVVVK